MKASVTRTCRARVRHAAAAARRWWAAARLPLLEASGLGLLALAAGMLAVPAGVAIAGIGCLLMSWRLSR